MGAPLLHVYLRDHLAGAAAGERLAGWLRAAQSHGALEPLFERLHDEIRDDRAQLLRLMKDVGARPSRLKAGAARLLETAGRLKLNGRLVRRSPLSSLVELEALAAGVSGKRSLWASLSSAGIAPGSVDLTELRRRADDQLRLLDAARPRIARAALAGHGFREARPGRQEPSSNHGGEVHMELRSLDDVLMEQLADLHSAEQQLVQALPQMAGSASTPQLRQAMEQHLEETRGHVRRLEQGFSLLGKTPRDEHCKGMEGLIKEGESIIQADADPAARDAALIGAAQRVEHYEIAGYGTARTLADQLGHDELKDLLDDTLDEESAADSKLTKIATGGMLGTGVNEQAIR
jgi:ferritin-like metal-binding protein YciE